MAAPITWQNINAPSFADSSRALALAQQSISGAFDNLKGTLADTQAFNKDLWKRQDQQATQDVLGKIYQAQNVGEFNALNQSGALDQAVAANGAVIDRAAVNALRDGRIGTLQQREKQAGEFSDWTTTREQRPIVNGIMTDIYRGNTDLAAKTLADNPNLLNAPDIQKALTEHKRKLVLQGREDTRFQWDQESQKWKVAEEEQKVRLRPLELQLAQLAPEAKRAQIAASNASTAASEESALTSRATRERIEAEAKKAGDLRKLGAALEGNIYNEGVYKDADTVDIAKLMKDTGVAGTGDDAGEKRTKIIERLNALSKNGIEIKGPDGNPVTVPLPLGAVKASILGANNTLLSWNEGYADSFEKNLKARMQAIYNRPGPDGKPMAANRAIDDYQNYLAIMRGTAEIAPASNTRRR